MNIFIDIISAVYRVTTFAVWLTILHYIERLLSICPFLRLIYIKRIKHICVPIV